MTAPPRPLGNRIRPAVLEARRPDGGAICPPLRCGFPGLRLMQRRVPFRAARIRIKRSGKTLRKKTRRSDRVDPDLSGQRFEGSE